MLMEQDFDQLRKREWVREVFTPRDAIVYDGKGGSSIQPSIKPGGWDHEHCLVCEATISDKSESHWYGYSDEDDHWLCEACYARHISRVHGGPPARPNHRSLVGRIHPWRRRERRGRGSR
jgi:hypothetical protein